MTPHEQQAPKRDPRVDPKPGDVLEKDGLRRKVISIIPLGYHWEIEYYRPKYQRLGKCWKYTWLKWARRAEVLHAAD